MRPLAEGSVGLFPSLGRSAADSEAGVQSPQPGGFPPGKRERREKVSVPSTICLNMQGKTKWPLEAPGVDELESLLDSGHADGGGASPAHSGRAALQDREAQRPGRVGAGCSQRCHGETRKARPQREASALLTLTTNIVRAPTRCETSRRTGGEQTEPP